MKTRVTHRIGKQEVLTTGAVIGSKDEVWVRFASGGSHVILEMPMSVAAHLADAAKRASQGTHH